MLLFIICFERWRIKCWQKYFREWNVKHAYKWSQLVKMNILVSNKKRGFAFVVIGLCLIFLLEYQTVFPLVKKATDTKIVAKGIHSERHKVTRSAEICSQDESKQYIRHACSQTQSHKTKRVKTRLVIDDRRRIAYCEIPKAASTTWRRLMLLAASGENNSSRHSDYAVHGIRLLPQRGLRKAVYDDSMQNYTKFVILRNPIDRFVSAYYNKVQKLNLTRLIDWELKESVDQFAVSYSAELHSDRSRVKFKDYTSLVLTVNESRRISKDCHWIRYASKCNLCDIRFVFYIPTKHVTSWERCHYGIFWL